MTMTRTLHTWGFIVPYKDSRAESRGLSQCVGLEVRLLCGAQFGRNAGLGLLTFSEPRVICFL